MKFSESKLSTLLVSLVSLLIVVILVEGAFRLVGIPYKVKYDPSENSFARFDPELGWSYIPNRSSVHNTDDITKPAFFDENGIRIPSPDFMFDYSKPSILFIGGSFTMGHGLTYEESFAGKFGAIKGMPYQVVNLGVQGYGSDQALLSLKRYLPKFKPKVVVYTFIADHIYRNGNHDRRMLTPSARFLGTKPQFALNNNNELYLAKKPRLYKNYPHSFLLDFIKIRIGTMTGHFPPFPEELTKAIIREMKKYSNEHNARFVILNWRWSRNEYNRLFNDWDIDVIDTMENAPNDWGKMVLHEGIHPNHEASSHAVQLLLEYFQKKNIFQTDQNSGPVNSFN